MPEILERVTEVQRQAEREREEELLDNLLERDRAHAVFGVAAVLEAVAEGRVHTLVYGAETSLEGSECSSCGWLMAGPAATACPRCNGRLVAVPDLMERVVSLVLQAGGRVEEVRGPAMKTLAGREGLSALLRYTPGRTQHRNHEIHSR
jgi:peptide subunit release factor 1 (eRF1)